MGKQRVHIELEEDLVQGLDYLASSMGETKATAHRLALRIGLLEVPKRMGLQPFPTALEKPFTSDIGLEGKIGLSPGPSILEFSILLGVKLTPVQSFILSSFYGLSVSPDEKRYWESLYGQLRSSFFKRVEGEVPFLFSLLCGRRSGKTFLLSLIASYELFLAVREGVKDNLIVCMVTHSQELAEHSHKIIQENCKQVGVLGSQIKRLLKVVSSGKPREISIGHSGARIVLWDEISLINPHLEIPLERDYGRQFFTMSSLPLDPLILREFVSILRGTSATKQAARIPTWEMRPDIDPKNFRGEFHREYGVSLEAQESSLSP